MGSAPIRSSGSGPYVVLGLGDTRYTDPAERPAAPSLVRLLKPETDPWCIPKTSGSGERTQKGEYGPSLWLKADSRLESLCSPLAERRRATELWPTPKSGPTLVVSVAMPRPFSVSSSNRASASPAHNPDHCREVESHATSERANLNG
jgi:hypothetical protein